MRDKIEYKGYWWLPYNPDETVAGILTYIPGEKMILELIGAFDSSRESIIAFMNKKNESVIHGLTSDSKKVTLINCHPSGSANLTCSFPVIRYHCRFFVIGKHIEDFKQKCFWKAHVKISDLSYWCPPAALKTVYQFDKDENNIENTLISFKTENKIVSDVAVDDNTQLKITEGIYYHEDHYSPDLKQYTYIEILKENETSIEDFYANIFMYEQFLSLATLQTVKCSEIILFDRSVFQELNNGEKRYHPIQLIYLQRDINESQKSPKYDFLFDYNSIAPKYSEVLQKWYAEKEDIAPIRSHLIDSIKDKKVFSSVDFLIVIQAIEGFWWRFRDHNYKFVKNIPSKRKTELKIIIFELLEEFKCISKINNIDMDIDSVVDSRHYYSHFMNKSKKPKTLEGSQLYEMMSKLRKLLICCLLSFIGFENTQINSIFNSSNSNLLNK